MNSVLYCITCILIAVLIYCGIFRKEIKKAIRRRKEEIRRHPESKIQTSKVVMVSVTITYFIGFGVGVWVVVTKDVYQLGTLLTYTGSVAASVIAFNVWKSKAENVLKIKKQLPELQGTLSDIANMM